MSVSSMVKRMVAKRPQQFYVRRSTRQTVEGHVESGTQRLGPYSGALFDPTMTPPGGPNTPVEDIRTDSGWRLTYAPLPDGTTLVDAPSERDTVEFVGPGFPVFGVDPVTFRVLKVTPLGGAVQPGGFRAILEKIT